MPNVQHKDLSGADLHATKDNSVGATQLQSDAVETAKVKDDNITDAKLATKTFVKGNVAMTIVYTAGVGYVITES